MATFSLGKHPHVELCDLLKLEGWSESGAQAKIAIADGLVKVDGAVETRKRCWISDSISATSASSTCAPLCRNASGSCSSRPSTAASLRRWAAMAFAAAASSVFRRFTSRAISNSTE